jgi:hypothetical protein
VITQTQKVRNSKLQSAKENATCIGNLENCWTLKKITKFALKDANLVKVEIRLFKKTKEGIMRKMVEEMALNLRFLLLRVAAGTLYVADAGFIVPERIRQYKREERDCTYLW